MEQRMIASPVLVKEYFDPFVNRRAYTVQSFRPHPESGRHYYYRPAERWQLTGLREFVSQPDQQSGRKPDEYSLSQTHKHSFPKWAEI